MDNLWTLVKKHQEMYELMTELKEQQENNNEIPFPETTTPDDSEQR